MALFRKHQARRFLGIDIGSSGVKVVECVESHGVPELATYGAADFPMTGRQPDVAAIASTIDELCARARVVSKDVVTALPSQAVFSAVMSVPKVAAKEQQAAVAAEAQKILPRPLADMRLDWKDVGMVNATTMNVMLTAAPLETVNRYVSIFKKTSLTLLGLDTEAHALIRSLVGNDPAPTMLLDIGAATTDIIMVDGALPVMSRSVTMAGTALTQAVAAATHATSEDAEQMKRDAGLAPGSTIPATYLAVIDPLMNEVLHTLHLYQQRYAKPVEKIVLSGGGALLPGFAEYLAQKMAMRVYVGNPWGRVRFPVELQGVLEQLSGRFAIAVGLALRELK